MVILLSHSSSLQRVAITILSLCSLTFAFVAIHTTADIGSQLRQVEVDVDNL